jgi:predicted aminopeptidase
LVGLLPLLTGCYFIQQGIHQLEIVAAAQPIEKVLEQPTLSEKDRAQLHLIQEIKKYSEERVGMTPTQNFSTFYDPGPRPISYIVSGSKKDRFEPHLWYFSIVGAVPYKGFFDKEDAEHERRRMEELGYDTSIQPVAAYSTLGYFKDPVLAHFLRYSRAELTNLIVHELAHSTVYAAGHTDFNESMAEFVAREAGLQFLKDKYGAESEEVREFIEEGKDADLFEIFMEGVYGSLDALYRSEISEEEKLKKREEIFAAAQQEFRSLKPRFKQKNYDNFDRMRLNNAVILSRRLYMRFGYWQNVFEKAGRSWPAFWNLTREAAKAPRPFVALDELIK